MLAYEFYLNDRADEACLIGILPERRKNKRRVTKESIMRWGKLVASGNMDPNNIYYIKVKL